MPTRTTYLVALVLIATSCGKREIESRSLTNQILEGFDYVIVQSDAHGQVCKANGLTENQIRKRMNEIGAELKVESKGHLAYAIKESGAVQIIKTGNKYKFIILDNPPAEAAQQVVRESGPPSAAPQP